jgi:hypothetical protein
MRITFQVLKKVAQERDCQVERQRGGFEWYRNDDHSVVAWCKTMEETYNELLSEVGGLK